MVICAGVANCAVILQATFFIAATIAARLGTAALAAHAVVSQLWVLASYIVDGFAVAGTVLGSRLVALRHQAGGSAGGSAVQVRHWPRCPAICCHQVHESVHDALCYVQSLQTLTRRLILLAVSLGCVHMLLFAAFGVQLIGLFTRDTETIRILRGPLWLVLTAAQPVNSAVYVLDGLLYATQSFPFVAAMMASGFAGVFVPVLAWSQVEFQAVWGIWLAKAALNVWRLGLASGWLHIKFLRTPAHHPV